MSAVKVLLLFAARVNRCGEEDTPEEEGVHVRLHAGTDEEQKPSVVLNNVIGRWDGAPLPSQRGKRVWEKCGPR